MADCGLPQLLIGQAIIPVIGCIRIGVIERPELVIGKCLIRTMDMQSLPHKEEPAAFLPVIPSPLKQPAPASTSITVELTTGHRVTVNQADEQIVRLLLSALL